MPDQSEVESALAGAVSSALYPEGVDFVSALGMLCRVYRGYPIASALNSDLAANRLNVSVTPVDGSLQLTTRYLPTFQNTPTLPALTASVQSGIATFAGTASAGQLAGLLVDNASYVHRTTKTDTPELVAASLAVLVRADRPARLAGASVAVPGASRLIARTVADTPDTLELRRQVQTFRVTIWAPSPTLRDAAGALIDATLAAIPFLDVDDTACRMLAAGTATSDQSQNAALYRRDLLFSVEYPTTVTATRPAMLFGTLVENSVPYLA